MTKLEFCERFVNLKTGPITFKGRPYLPKIYASRARRIVIRASRQVEKSTFLANTIMHLAVTRPGSRSLYICPRQDQARLFSKSRLLRSIQDSPVIRRVLLGRNGRTPAVMDLLFENGSEVNVRAAFLNADAARGIDADMLLVDEFQDVADGHLPILEETLSHSNLGRIFLTGTPKTIDNHLESVFRQSTACEFKVPCSGCSRDVLLDERCLGPLGLICPNCQHAIDPRTGRWVARNPQSTWGEGYWLNHLLVPWVNFAELLERQRTYDPALFKNECLGLPTNLGDHVVTRAELEACCTNRPMLESLNSVPASIRKRLFAGVDWGGGGNSQTVVVIGHMDDQYRFHVLRFDRIRGSEEPDHVLRQVAEICRRFRISWIGADAGGNGYVYNRLLASHLDNNCTLYGILYSTSEQEPRQDGLLWHWTVNRSASIGTVFSRVKKKSLLFPRVDECGSYLDELAAEIAEHDDFYRRIKFIHAETQRDDALHVTNYALLMGIRAHGSKQIYGQA